MSTFTVWKFDTPEGAEHAMTLLDNAEQDGLVKVVDHAMVSWPVGADKPTVHHGRDDAKRGAGWGAFWGLLLGALFMVPVLGVVAGASIGALSKASEKLGVSRESLESIRDEVTEGTSALFIVTEDGNLDRLGERFRGMHMRLVETNLTPAEQDELLQTFGSG